MRTMEATVDPVAAISTTATMKALVYGGPGLREWTTKPRPVIQEPGDAVVRMTTSTICGTDLHIMKGDVPTVTASAMKASASSTTLVRSSRRFAKGPE